jgi:hypothetical protein
MLSSSLLSMLLAASPLPELGKFDDPFTLTVSGGVSLGTYESGLTWTLVRLSKGSQDPEEGARQRVPTVLAITGASAGSINTLLAGALWCEGHDEKDNLSVDQNLLREAWVSVGLDALLPANSGLYTPDDGLLASSALMPVVARIRERIFTPKGMRFEAGCRLPLGFTVTRVNPEELHVSGLAVPIQRAVLPLLFEVSGAGKAWVHRQQLGNRISEDGLLRLADSIDASGTFISPDTLIQSLLASAAFPLAFGPRALCECAVQCGSGREVTATSCPGPDAKHPLEHLSCAAYSNAAGGREMALCKSSFVDGGVFDNAPVGLAIDQAEAFARWRILRPLTAVFLDPDTRRLQPPPKEQNENSGRGISGAVDLAFTLVGTARKRELADSVSSRQWNLTTRHLLWRTSALLTEYASVLLQLIDLEGEPTEVPPPPMFQGSLKERIRLSHVLSSCVRRLAVATPGPGALALDESCAAAARQSLGEDPLAGDPSELARATVPLTDAELIQLAEGIATIASETNARRRVEEIVLRNRKASPEERRQVAETTARRAQIGAAVLALLTDELPRVTHGDLTDDALRRLRTALLKYVELARTRAERLNRMANSVVIEQLRVLVAHNVPLAPGVEAARALAALTGVPDTVPFALQPLQPVLASLQATPPEQLNDALRVTWGRLERLVQLRPRLGALTAQSLQVSQDAAELEDENSGERKLVLTTRFSPLAGSQLGNFGGFLDRPLREVDYYIGVYDGLHEAAVHWCDAHDPYESPWPPPLRKLDGSGELEFSKEGTQLCLGAAMGVAIRWLRLFDSSKASTVVQTLARKELAAALGSSLAAQRVAAQAEWRWLAPTPPELKSIGNVGKVLAVLLSNPIACEPGATERLCFGELSFDAFMTELVAEGYVGESENMRTALDSRRRWFTGTLKRAVDRAATVEIQQPSGMDTGTEGMVNLGIGATELLTRSQTYETGVRFVLDPSSIPTTPLANGSYLPIVLAHLVPYRVALDVVGGGLALSWIEPELWLAKWFSLDTTLQLVDIQFSPAVTATTLGLRAVGHVGAFGIAAGPRWSLYWSGSDASNFGVEFDLTFLQDRFGLSFGFRNITPAGWYSPFVALTIADLNGALYWLIPSAWRSGR